MNEQPTSMELVLPKSVRDRIDRLRDANRVFNAVDSDFDPDKALSDALSIAKALAAHREAEANQDPIEPKQGEQGIQPIPNVPKTSSPEFELLPVRPGDKPPEFLPIPNIIDTPSDTPSELPPTERRESGPPLPTDGQTQGFDESILKLFADSYSQLNHDSGIGSNSTATDGRETDQDDSKYEAMYKQYMRFYPSYEPPWSRGDQKSPSEHSANSTGQSNNPEQGSEPDNTLHDILPTVKSGCEAMIKLAEIGGDIQKQLAELIEQKDGGKDVPNLDKGPNKNKPELEGIYQNPGYEEFARAYEAFRNRSNPSSLEPRALRRNP